MGWFFLIIMLLMGFDHVGTCLREIRDEIKNLIKEISNLRRTYG